MATPLRVLLVEDDPDDAALVIHELRKAGYDPIYQRVDTAEGMRTALAREDWEIVLSDFSMPGFGGPHALRLLREGGFDLPFILVSGTVGEDAAVEAMRTGANDYMIKGRLARLAPAVERELQENALRRAHREVKAAVGRRDAILKAVVGAAERLLRGTDWEQGIHGVLAELGQAIEVSRTYICESHAGEDGERLASVRFEWAAPGTTLRAADPALRQFPWRASGLTRWEEVLSAGEILYGRVRDLAQGEREFLEAQGVHSFACVPIFVGRNWWGVIGFDDCLGEREWSTAELDALKTAAGTLAAAIQRRQVEEQVQRQVRRLAGLRAINVAITASLDLGVTLNVFLDQVTTQLAVDAANVLLFRPQTRTLEYAAGRGFRAGAFQHTRLALGEGYAGRAARERRRGSISDLSQEPGGLGRAAFAAGERFVGYLAIPLVSKGQIKGVLELFHHSTLDAAPEWLEFAHTLAGQAAVAIDNALLFEDLQRSNLELGMAYDTTLEGWSRALDLRDEETEGHTQRVTEVTLRLARALGVSDADLVHVRRGSLLHDIGKMGIPDRILLKPGPLTEDEWEIMRRHPVYAFELLSPISYLRPALDIPYCHHERWDGTGYPRGLKGATTPLAARAFAVVDVWDALRSNRPYRAAWPEERVSEHMRGLSGTHFDPAILETFFAVLMEAGAARVLAQRPKRDRRPPVEAGQATPHLTHRPSPSPDHSLAAEPVVTPFAAGERAGTDLDAREA
jgi:putative nucleotidyltransferase with HDIG domain